MKWWQFLLFVMALYLVVSVVMYYRFPETHYIGKTEITIEQISKLPADIRNGKYNKLTVTENKVILFDYDFYSADKYEFLNTYDGGVLDSEGIHIMFKFNSIQKVEYPILAVVLIAYFVAQRKAVQIRRLFPKIIHWFEKREDDKYSLESSQLIASKPMDVNYDNGIIAVRCWGIEKGQLKSVVMDTRWISNSLTSDKQPTNNDVRGIYGFRLGAISSYHNKVMGIVELRGKYEYHPDGVIRAENCKILGFFMSSGYQRLGRIISNNYNVPLMFDKTATEGYLHWLYSEYGQKALEHNYNLLKEG